MPMEKSQAAVQERSANQVRQAVLVNPVMVSMSVANRTSMGVIVCFVVVVVVVAVVVVRYFLRK